MDEAFLCPKPLEARSFKPPKPPINHEPPTVNSRKLEHGFRMIRAAVPYALP